jgi:hypothetical protein
MVPAVQGLAHGNEQDPEDRDQREGEEPQAEAP